MLKLLTLKKECLTSHKAIRILLFPVYPDHTVGIIIVCAITRTPSCLEKIRYEE